MKVRGLDVLRFTRIEVTREPEKVARELRTARSMRAVRHRSGREGA
jgi:very-short-patch-repair endonuclease